jgi:hypothetical protein
VKGEELERSLNAEFESYLKETLEEVRRELTQLEEKVFTEIENQKRKLEELFKEAKNRIPENKELDPGLRGSVAEHLRLAKDEGAQIAATAMAEAQELEKRMRAAEPGFAELSKAIKEISMKTTQADILTSLLSYAEKFAARGALFIVKNERFIGWRPFGEEKEQKEEAIKNINLPVTSHNILSAAVNSLKTIDVSDDDYPGDKSFLERIGYGSLRMVAIPLIVRGRGVAVLYAEKGAREKIYVEALESLVQVTSMTVEILASLKLVTKKAAEEAAKETAQTQVPPTPAYEAGYKEAYHAEIGAKPEPYEKVAEEKPSEEEVEHRKVEVKEEVKEEAKEIPSVEEGVEKAPAAEEAPTVEEKPAVEEVSAVEEATVVEEKPAVEEVPVVEEKPVVEEVPTVGLEYQRETDKVATTFKPGELERSVETKVPPSTTVTTIVTPGVSRLADRPIDLPVEVSSEEERRYHNEARRFARLLVSEIKLYNEQKVKEGREAGDLYDRLREAIDRSREMYDKRVKPIVASKFDYFHYELVHSLAEGDVSKLGKNYPGPSV